MFRKNKVQNYKLKKFNIFFMEKLKKLRGTNDRKMYDENYLLLTTYSM